MQLRKLQHVMPAASRGKQSRRQHWRVPSDQTAGYETPNTTKSTPSVSHKMGRSVGDFAAIGVHDGMHGDVTFSFEQCLDNLAEARREWMIYLHRYCSTPDNNSHNNNVHLRRDEGRNWRKESLFNLGESMENVVRRVRSSLRPEPAIQNGTRSAQLTPQISIVHAADFCQNCAAIVNIDLVYGTEGLFVAEANRAECSSCASSHKSPEDRGRYVPG